MRQLLVWADSSWYKLILTVKTLIGCELTWSDLFFYLSHHLWCSVNNLMPVSLVNPLKVGQVKTCYVVMMSWWSLSLRFALISCVQLGCSRFCSCGPLPTSGQSWGLGSGPGLMSHSPGKKGGLSQAAPNVNSQDLFDNPTQTAATGNTPEDQVRVLMCC